MDNLLKSVVAYKAIDHFVTSADARLSYRSNREQLEYLRARDAELARQSNANSSRISDDGFQNRKYIEEQRRLDREHASVESYLNRAHMSQEAEYNRQHAARQAQLERDHQSRESAYARDHEDKMQTRELDMRSRELEMKKYSVQANERFAYAQLDATIRTAELEREARLAMHARELDQNEQLEIRKMRVQQNIADQNEALQKYLLEKGIKSAQEIEHFKALATRETQILLARENAQNILQDHLVQEALKNFPLNISPIVLLRNRPHSLKGLLRFSSRLADNSYLPDISQVYNDVKLYSENPEALNIFIAPIHIGAAVDNRVGLSQQIWDAIYQDVESFFIEHYNRGGAHPVILYPTAWKDDSAAGQHASETLHFFLKDMPCLVLEPHFDGHSLSVMMSSWGLGYLSTDHVRTEMRFDINLDALLIESAFERSRKSLNVLKKLSGQLDSVLEDKKNKLLQNVQFYETLNLKDKIASNDLDDLEALGVYNLFDIVPSQDMGRATKIISSLLCVNLAVISDVHHLQATDTMPIFPQIFKANFDSLYGDVKLRELIAQCYERVFIFLRNQDANAVDKTHRREMERVRELQITNLNKMLELIDEAEVINTIEDKLRKYALDRHGWDGYGIDELWSMMIEHMADDDISFFKELLPNIDDRRRYKQIDKKIAELQRN